MSNQKDNKPDLLVGKSSDERRMLPFFIEFVKFLIAFAAIVAAALLALRVVSAHM